MGEIWENVDSKAEGVAAVAMDLAELRRRAINKALAMGGAAAVTRVRYGTYQVASRTREQMRHTVSVTPDGTYHCTCEAGLQERACWHAAAVYVAKVEAGGGRVVAPAAPADSAAPVEIARVAPAAPAWPVAA